MRRRRTQDIPGDDFARRLEASLPTNSPRRRVFAALTDDHRINVHRAALTRPYAETSPRRKRFLEATAQSHVRREICCLLSLGQIPPWRSAVAKRNASKKTSAGRSQKRGTKKRKKNSLVA